MRKIEAQNAKAAQAAKLAAWEVEYKAAQADVNARRYANFRRENRPFWRPSAFDLFVALVVIPVGVFCWFAG